MSSRDDPAAGATANRWLAIVGIGEDGIEGLSPAARRAVEEAEFVFGGARHLDLAKAIVRGEARPWPSPFDIAGVVALRGRKVCVLASGDPFFHGVGATLARQVDPAEMSAFPAPSAFSLAAARLGWALHEAETVSLHGRPLELLLPVLHPGRRVLVLTSDGAGPAAIARLAAQRGFGRSRLHVLEALGGADERVSSFAADEAGDRIFHPLNVVAVEVAAGPDAAVVPLGCPPDDAFEHDGQITKHAVRAVTLAALAPRRGELLWDVGAGAGSIAISWMLAHPSMRAVAIEADERRAERIGRNAKNLGVPGLAVVHGAAPGALAGLPSPDAVFIGGGGSDPGVADAAIAALLPGGRLVANAVTTAMEAVLLSLHARLGGELTRIAVARAAPVGAMTGWKAAAPVTQYSWTKP